MSSQFEAQLDAGAAPLGIAVLTVSDTRTADTDESGRWLSEQILREGHGVCEKCVVKDNVYAIRAVISRWIAAENINVVLTTGGTGLTGRDSTPEAVRPLLDKELEGFGALFRQISFAEIGTSALQSRALAGVANATYIFCLPGSQHACATGWTHLIRAQLDSRTRPCNLSNLVARLRE